MGSTQIELAPHLPPITGRSAASSPTYPRVS